MISDVRRLPKTVIDKFQRMYEMAELTSRFYAEKFVYNILGMRGNIAGFIVALVSAVIIGIVIMIYMVDAAKDAAGNDSQAIAQIDKITNIAYIALFFAAFVGFVVAAKYILDIISGSNKGGGM